MEIERKFTIQTLPANLSSYPCHIIEQAYLNISPVIRIRQENDQYYLTCKGQGLMAREEYTLPLDAAAYKHLLSKADGNVITKKRYLIPLEHPKFTDDYLPVKMPQLVIELDIFDAPFAPLIIAEVEFGSIEMANAFLPPDWFDQEVTHNPAYHNSNMSRQNISL